MSADQRPNVLFLFSDQHRGTDLGCAGNEDVATPNLDRLAHEGRRLETACANTPVCTPSRASLLTGQYPLTHRVIANDLPLPTDVPSVAEAFRDAGYRTGYIGKWHLDGVPREKFTPPGPRRQGFDDCWAVWNCSHAYYDATYYRDTPTPIEIDGYEPIAQTDLAIEFLEGDDDRPFCLFLSWGPPHAPYDQVPDRYRDQYDPARIALRRNAEPIPPETSDIAAGLTPADTIANYYAHITAIDDQVGRLLDHLDASEACENTIVTYTSDHGDMLWSHGKFKKEQPWTESIEIPFIIRHPGSIAPNTTDDLPFGIVDVAPTLLGLAGVNTPDAMEGEDWSARFRGESTDDRESVFVAQVVRNSQARAQHLPPWRGVRTRRHTYVRLRDGQGWLLYDNGRDPYQLENLIYQDAPTRRRLDRLLDRWLDETGDAFRSEHDHVREVDMVEAYNARIETFPWLEHLEPVKSA